MSNFGEDLRKERMSRGIALEHISAVTKISERHLVALEQERFRLLPGGILSKGRFLQACSATGQTIDNDSGWTAFASNVGKARMERHNEQEIRMRWIGAIVLALVASVGGFFSVRYYGVQAGWWSSLLPVGGTAAHSAITSTHSAVARILTMVGL
jgi:cytoskeleton protein RodZ